MPLMRETFLPRQLSYIIKKKKKKRKIVSIRVLLIGFDDYKIRLKL